MKYKNWKKILEESLTKDNMEKCNLGKYGVVIPKGDGHTSIGLFNSKSRI